MLILDQLVVTVASEEVVELMKKMSSNSVLCNRSLSPEQSIHYNSLDFAVDSCFSRIFCIKSRETIT